MISLNLKLIILCSLSCFLIIACQPSQPTDNVLPTLARYPTLTATIPASEVILSSPSPTLTTTATHTSTATITPTNTATMTATQAVTMLPSATATVNLTLSPLISVTPTSTATALPQRFVFGQSAEGRELIAYRYGTGRYVIMLIGGIHAGFESNTIELMQRFQNHFHNNPDVIDPNITFLIVPSLNPDGATRGRILEGRFNGNGVDLNRNWGCGWSPNAVFNDNPVDAGDEAFSEPETTALGSLIQRVNPAVVLFYHAAANGVFAGDCEDSTTVSAELGALYGEISGYPYRETFDEYVVTGTGPAWVDSIGIPSLDVELASAEVIEFERNWRAVDALQEWIQTR